MRKRKHAATKSATPARKVRVRVVTAAAELTTAANLKKIQELRRIRFPSHDGKVGRPKELPDVFGII
jgi:hypothetical protein